VNLYRNLWRSSRSIFQRPFVTNGTAYSNKSAQAKQDLKKSQEIRKLCQTDGKVKMRGLRGGDEYQTLGQGGYGLVLELLLRTHGGR